MKAFLLAAGVGSRLQPITDTIPKCMVAIGRWPLLDIWLEAFDRAASTSAQAAAGAKLNRAECQAAKSLDIAVNPQFGQLDYSQFQVVSVPSPVTRPPGPTTPASPVATAPAC